MKKYLSLALCIIMIMSSLLLVSCDILDSNAETETNGDVTSETEKKESETTEPETTEPETTEPESDTPIEVETLGGKNALGLYRKADEEINYDDSFEGTVTTTKTVDGETTTTVGIMKVSNNNLYIKTTEDGEVTELTAMNGTVYMSAKGKKIKTTGVDMNELWADLSLSSDIEFADSRFDGIKLYCLDDVYYFTLQLTAEEAEMLGMEYDTASVTFYYDSNAILTKINYYQKNYQGTEVYSNIGKAVTVSAPQNESEYITAVSNTDWQKYKTVCQKLASMTSYNSTIEMFNDGERVQCMEYNIDTVGNEHIKMVSGYDVYHIYKYNGSCYAVENGSAPEEGEPTEDILTTFANMAAMKNTSAAKIAPKYGISSMSVTTNVDDTTIIIKDLSDNTVKYTYNATYSQITVEMIYDDEGVETSMTMQYERNDGSYVINPFAG